MDINLCLNTPELGVSTQLQKAPIHLTNVFLQPWTPTSPYSASDPTGPATDFNYTIHQEELCICGCTIPTNLLRLQKKQMSYLLASYSIRGHFLCVLSRLVRKPWVLLRSSDANSGHCTLLTLVYDNFHHKHHHHLSKLACLLMPLHFQLLWACQRTWLMYGYKLLCGIIVSSNFGLADLEAFNVPGTLFLSSLFYQFQ